MQAGELTLLLVELLGLGLVPEDLALSAIRLPITKINEFKIIAYI